METVHRGLAENSVGPVIDQLPRADPVSVDELGFAALHRNGTQLLVRFVAAACELGSLAGHWPFDQWGRLLAEATTTVSRLDRRLHHAVTVVTSG